MLTMNRDLSFLRRMCCLCLLAAGGMASAFADEVRDASLDFTTERVVLTGVKGCETLGDTLRASARIVSSDSTQQSYSRYAYVELIGGSDSILIRQKYRCDGSGRFDIAVPTGDLRYSGLYYLRTYTRHMLNFSEQSHTVVPVVLGSRMSGYEYPTGLRRYDSEEGGVMARRCGERVSVQVLGWDEGSGKLQGSRLYCFHDDIGLQQLPLTAEGSCIIDTGGLGGQSLLSLFLVDRSGTLTANTNLCVTDITDFTQPPVWVTDLDVATAYAAAGIDSRGKLDEWVGEGRFCRFDVEKVLAGNFRFEHPVERVMTIDGRVLLEGGHPAKHGDVSAFSPNSMAGGEAVLDSKGEFKIEVPDFSAGTRFFVSARIGKKHKSTLPFLGYEFQQESATIAFIPSSARMIPVTKEAVQESTLMSEGMKGDIILSSATVRSYHKPANRPDGGRFYQGNYVDVRGDYGRYPTFESILRRIPRVRIEKEIMKTGSYLPTASGRMEAEERIIRVILPSRGDCFMSANKEIGANEQRHVAVMVDGYYIDNDEAFDMNTFDIEDVEYLDPHEAIRISPKGFNGLLVVRTRQADSEVIKRRNAKGAWVTPLGLSNVD